MEQADGTSTHGNTKTVVVSKGKKSRKYFVTFWINDYPRELPDKAKYMCTCEDSTKDGKFHGHAFIYFNNPVTMSRIKKIFGNDCHVEQPMKNSDCIDYVLDNTKRKHDFQEFGKKPMNNGMTLKVHELKNCDDPDELEWNLYNTWVKVRNAPKKIKLDDWKKEVKVFYIQGPSGVGKTEKAKEILRENQIDELEEIKYESNFYHGVVDGTGAAIYDDFRDSHMKASEFINLIDYNTHNMNIKGGSVRNHYNIIIITSVQSIDQIYYNMSDEPRKQWMRRVKVIDMFTNDL